MKKRLTITHTVVCAAFLMGILAGLYLCRKVVAEGRNRMSVQSVDYWGRMHNGRYFVRSVERGKDCYNLNVWGANREVDGFAFDQFRFDLGSSNMVVSYYDHFSTNCAVFTGRVYVGSRASAPSAIYVEAFLVKDLEKTHEIAPHFWPERLYVTGSFDSGMSDLRWKFLSILEDED